MPSDETLWAEVPDTEGLRIDTDRLPSAVLPGIGYRGLEEMRADGGVMQPGQLDVDKELLERLAGEVKAAGLKLQAGVTAAGSGLAPPQPGFAAGAAARAAEKAWLADLGRLHRDIGAFAENLAGAAKDYHATDQANADGLRAAGGGSRR